MAAGGLRLTRPSAHGIQSHAWRVAPVAPTGLGARQLTNEIA
jgi:hypothetical protein